MKKNTFIMGTLAALLAFGLMLTACGKDDDTPPPDPDAAAKQAAGDLAADLGAGATVDPTDPTKVNVTGALSPTGELAVGEGVTLAVQSGGSLTLSDGATLAGGGTIALDGGSLVDTREGTSGYFGALAGDEFTIEIGAGATLSTKDGTTDRPLFGEVSNTTGQGASFFQLDSTDKVELVGDGDGHVTVKITGGTVDLNRPEVDKSWTASAAMPLEIAPGATLLVKAGNLNIDDNALTVNGTLEISGGTHLAYAQNLFTNSSTGTIKVFHGGSIIRIYGGTVGNGAKMASLVVGGIWANGENDKKSSYFVWNDTNTTGTDFITFDLGAKAITISSGSTIKLYAPAEVIDGYTQTAIGGDNWLKPLTFKSGPTTVPASGTYQFTSLTVSSDTLVGGGTTPTLVIDTGGSISGLNSAGIAVSIANTYTWNSSAWAGN
jgi:hypothetical protein